MAEITSEAVGRLRAKTGAGLMDCKRALTQTGGDLDKAIQVLREQGAASAAKRADRATVAGLVTAVVEPGGRSATLLELNCETDFVAGTDEFKALVRETAQALNQAPKAWKTAADAPVERVKEAALKLKENIQLRERRFARFDRQAPGLFASYIHPSGEFGSPGVLLELGVAGDASPALERDESKALARDLAMQIAAQNPRWVRKEDVPADIVEKEMAIGREQARRENKPEKIWDKIAEGKITQFYKQFCLLEQEFVKPVDGGKVTVAQVVERVSKQVGATLVPRRFVRLKVGEAE